MSKADNKKGDGSPASPPASTPPITTIHDGRTLIDIHTGIARLQSDVEHIKNSIDEIKNSVGALSTKVSKLEGQRNIVLGVLITIAFLGSVVVGAVALADKMLSMKERADGIAVENTQAADKMPASATHPAK